MNTSRLEAFSDAVLAVIITIMVLELKAPHGTNIAALRPLAPLFFAYVLSFNVIGTYWNNHHHLLRWVQEIDGRVMWANLHLLFWLSLIPFFTAWLGQNFRATWPTVLYGILLLICGAAYQILQNIVVASQPKGSIIPKRIGNDTKGKLSMIVYMLGVGLAFANHWFADSLYVVVAIMWLVPDHRFEPKAAARLSQP